MDKNALVSPAKYRLNSAFSKVFSGRIWRIKTDESAQLLAIETRDRNNGQPFFSVIHYPSGQVLLNEQTYGDRWWTLAAIAGERLLLQTMSTDGPQTHGLTALHSRTGETAWEGFQYRFLAVTAKGVAVQHRNVSGGPPSLLNILSGARIDTTVTDETLYPVPVHVTLPRACTEPPPAWLSAYPAEGPLFHTSNHDRDIFVFHERQQDAFALRILIFSGETVLYNQVIADSFEKILYEPFFILDNQLFAVSHQDDTIISYFV